MLKTWWPLLGSTCLSMLLACASDPQAEPGEGDAGSSSGEGGSSSGGGGETSSSGGSGGTSSSGGSGALPPTADDGIKNGDETGVDCGGPTVPARCAPGETCLEGSDCREKVCTEGICAEASFEDEVQNGDETGVDCGGPSAPNRCAPGQGCADAEDCTQGVCTSGTCAAPAYNDEVRNGDETGVDCGGPNAPNRCPPGQGCAEADDCVEKVCNAGLCAEARDDDNVRNGDETDVDCGGNGTPKRCTTGQMCAGHADCQSDGCAYNNRCAAGRSCTQRQGGDTCGKGADVGGQANENVSCCAQANLHNSNVKIDRFLVTAGRMRAFIERVGGDVEDFVEGLPAGTWTQSWNNLVPRNVVQANVMLGPYWNGAPNDPDGANSKRSCAAPNYNGHTYWIPKEALNPGDRNDSYDANQQYTQNQLDPKALNCVNWYLAKAFCTWEGGRLPTHAELRNAFTNGTGAGYPWSWNDGSPYSNAQDPRLNRYYNYQMPGGVSEGLDMAMKISPPGRYWLGWNQNQVEIAGNLLEWANDGERRFTWNFSFENHGSNTGIDNWGTPGGTGDRNNQPNGYYALGLRCAYDP